MDNEYTTELIEDIIVNIRCAETFEEAENILRTFIAKIILYDQEDLGIGEL